MNEWQLIGTLASILGFIAAIVVAIWQHRVANRAERKADAERERRASLEDHLERQRWQQLSSLGEQIDALEQDGRKEYEPRLASLHASLKEQYSSLLGVIATSSRPFDAEVLRFWVEIGRLKRPWQIAEALRHLDRKSGTGDADENEQWLKNLLENDRVVDRPRPVKNPTRPSRFVAAYLLVAYSVRDVIPKLIERGGQTEHSVALLLSYLADDCLSLIGQGFGRYPSLKAWGYRDGKSFVERFQYYQEQEFWLVLTASRATQNSLDGYAEFFDLSGNITNKLIPKDDAVKQARHLFPDIADQVQTLLNERRKQN